MPVDPLQDPLQIVIERFWETIPPVWGRIRANVRTTAIQNFDITVEQFHILRHIHRGIGQASDLADKLLISRSAISQAVEALVEKNLLARHQDETDRRCVRLELTPAGTELLNTIFFKNRQWMAEKMAGLTSAELASLLPALSILEKTFIESAG